MLSALDSAVYFTSRVVIIGGRGGSVFVAQNSVQIEAKVRSISVFLRSGMLQGIFACVHIRKFCRVEFGCRMGQ